MIFHVNFYKFFHAYITTFHFIKVLSYPPTEYKKLSSPLNLTRTTWEEWALKVYI